MIERRLKFICDRCDATSSSSSSPNLTVAEFRRAEKIRRIDGKDLCRSCVRDIAEFGDSIGTSPTDAQRLACAVRAAVEEYRLAHRTSAGPAGEFYYPDRAATALYASKKTGVRLAAISFCLTFSRHSKCRHAWSAGACAYCPEAGHIPF